MSGIDPVELLRVAGGSATRKQLLGHITRAALESAVRRGSVVLLGHGRYGLPDLPAPLHAAGAMRAVVSHASAARLLGLETMFEPRTVHLTVGPTSHRRGSPGVTLHYADTSGQTTGDVTVPLRTVLDCARTMPFTEALAVADSALRHRLVGRHELTEATDRVTGPGARRARDVSRWADGRAANPFESALRAIAIEAGLHDFEPQVRITCPDGVYRVDLADEKVGLVAEADSFTWHGDREALARDCRRYNDVIRTDRSLLRFPWEQVMFQQPEVATVLVDVHRLRADRCAGSIGTACRATSTFPPGRTIDPAQRPPSRGASRHQKR